MTIAMRGHGAGARCHLALRCSSMKRFARSISSGWRNSGPAGQIVKSRKEAPFRETLALAKAIERIVGRHGRRHPATQIFQALRMEVNDELGALQAGLLALTSRLEASSRIAVITFHSLEDRIVKNFFRDRSREFLDRPEWPEPRPNPDFSLRLITPKPVEADALEQRVNPRSRSARLRVAERIG